MLHLVYTSACIESARIEQNQADKQLYDNISAIPGMKRMMHLITSWINGVWIEYFQNVQNLLKDITLKVIHKETSLSSINVKISNSISDKNSMSEMVKPRHQLQIKRRKKINDYSQKSINDF